MQFIDFPLWFGVAGLLYIAGSACLDAEQASRGKGSWYKDRELLQLCGAFRALALVALGLCIACVLS